MERRIVEAMEAHFTDVRFEFRAVQVGGRILGADALVKGLRRRSCRLDSRKVCGVASLPFELVSVGCRSNSWVAMLGVYGSFLARTKLILRYPRMWIPCGTLWIFWSLIWSSKCFMSACVRAAGSSRTWLATLATQHSALRWINT